MASLCKACGFDNPPGMRFCGNCGTRLSDDAPLSQTTGPQPADLGVMMGSDLIERFREAGLQAAGQRRNVTVLFVDLTDYTHLAEQIDSEDLYEIIQQFINMLVAAVYKYEGMVDKIVGDGLMALFGAPIGHENNAELAVRSAMDMQAGLAELNQDVGERLGQDLQMHIGLHSGTVIVGGVGSNMLMDYTAIGDTVNLAHRLEEAATPGVILVSESVYRQTRMLFNYNAVPSLQLKGIQRSVTGYQVVSPKERPGRVRGVEGLSSPMVGRDAELDLLFKAVSKMDQHSGGGFAIIFGEAGIGKSRLVAELKARIRQEHVSIFEGQSLTYRRSVAYWIFLDLMRNYLGVSANAPEAHVRAQLADRVESVLGDRAADAIPYLEHLLSLKPSSATAATRISQLDADQLRRQIFITVRDLLVAESHWQPVLLVLDDLHWADDASLDLLQFLLDTVHTAPLFVCGISRPVDEGSLTQIVEQAQKQLLDRYILIRLSTLPQEKAEQLLYQLLIIPDLPPVLREQIVQRAAGVPFYLEEILRMLIDDSIIYLDGNHWRLYSEADVSSIGVPDNLQALILARFDRLTQEQRRILQIAAVIGREFSVVLIEAILGDYSSDWIDDQLAELSDRGFIILQSGSHQADYAFRHVLTSDAIYSTLLRRDRGELHGQVGEAIEVLFADRLNEYTYLLARHFSWSPQLEKALHYLILAGKKSARDFVIDQAKAYYQQAKDLLPKVDHESTQAFDVYLGLGDALVFGGEYENARQHYRMAQKIIDKQKAEQPKSYVALLRNIGKTYGRQGDYEQALEYLAEANLALDCCPEEFSVERAEVWNDIGWIHFRLGDYSEAGELFQKALQLVVDSSADRVVASIYNRLGGVAYFQGNWDKAAEYLRNSIDLHESIGDVTGLASSTNNLGNLEIDMGLFDNALDDFKRYLALVKRIGQVEGIAVAYNNLGLLHTLRGETDEAEESLNRALELAQQIGFISLIREVQKNIGELRLALGQWDQAREVLSEVAPDFEDLGANDQLLHIYRLLGEIAINQGDLDSALKWALTIEAITEKHGDVPTQQQGELLLFRGMLAMEQDEFQIADKYLKQSLDTFRKLRSRLSIGRALTQLGQLAALQDDRSGAVKSYEEALSIFEEIGASLDAIRVNNALEGI